MSSQQPGIVNLMNDLGKANLDPSIYMFGGGNPALLDETIKYVKPIMHQIINDSNLLSQGLQNYCSSLGYEPFRETLANFMNKKMNWQISSDNICVTNGTQQAFYISFNQIITQTKNPKAKIFLIKIPDYIGYFDTIGADRFIGSKAKIKQIMEKTFRYEIDFPDIIHQLEKDKIKNEIAALVISSPNNPSSHSLNAQEVQKLNQIAQQYNKTIIFDHAYGNPIPKIIYDTVAQYPFYKNTIHFFSFSKFGMAGLRIGFLVANKEFISKIGIQNSIQCLAPSTFNAIFMNELIKNSNVEDYIENTLMPIYLSKRKIAIELISKESKNLPLLIHKSQGGFFLWLYCKNLNLTSKQVYSHLKEKRIAIIPGEYFFFEKPKECFLRLSFTPDKSILNKGLHLFMKELNYLYNKYSYS